MLFDAKWTEKVRELLPTPQRREPPALNLQVFHRWQKSKDPQEWYNFDNVYTCLLTQYFGDCQSYPVPQNFREGAVLTAMWQVAMTTPWTFGEAVKRCEHFLGQGYPYK